MRDKENDHFGGEKKKLTAQYVRESKVYFEQNHL